MLLEKISTALILGLSAERILLCPFMAMGLSLSDRGGGLKFILGRLAGISLLGLFISIIGVPFNIPPYILDGVFGLFLLGLGVNALLKSKHQLKQKKFSNAGFSLGLFRGMLNPGRKLVYLLPLLWGIRVVDGLAVSLAYGLSSSVYLLLGFFSAELLNRVSAYQKQIKLAGAIILLFLGGFYIFKFFQGRL
ncbi:MAG: hypothetical protein ABIG46_06460 [Candidatus Omnitrophota bacterium]|nr:hypothetical protein [Candidatus Omnitrophota bacterium]